MVQNYLFTECAGSPIKPNFERLGTNNLGFASMAAAGGGSEEGPSTPSRPFKSFFMFGSAMKGGCGTAGSPFGRQKLSAASSGSNIRGQTLASAFDEAKDKEMAESGVMAGSNEEDVSETPYFDTFDVTSLKDAHALLMQHIYRPSVQKPSDNSSSTENGAIDHTSNFHLTEIQSMNKARNFLTPIWTCQLAQGYHLCFHGYGSKQNILKNYAASKFIASQYEVLVVDGTHPDLSTDHIVDAIFRDYLKVVPPSRVVASLFELLQKRELERCRRSTASKRLLILTFNLDGLYARQEKFQEFYFSIAASSKSYGISLVATMDHIQAPMLWSSAFIDRSQWLFHDLTTFIPYTKELYSLEAMLKGVTTHGKNSLVTQMSAALTVMTNLTLSSRRIYALFIKHCLDYNSSTLSKSGSSMKATTGLDDAFGLSFHQYYSLARDQFLASSETSFRTQLREFLDHKLLLNKMTMSSGRKSVSSSSKNTEETDFFYLPFPPSSWQDILDNIEAL